MEQDGKREETKETAQRGRETRRVKEHGRTEDHDGTARVRKRKERESQRSEGRKRNRKERNEKMESGRRRSEG